MIIHSEISNLVTPFSYFSRLWQELQLRAHGRSIKPTIAHAPGDPFGERDRGMASSHLVLDDSGKSEAVSAPSDGGEVGAQPERHRCRAPRGLRRDHQHQGRGRGMWPWGRGHPHAGPDWALPVFSGSLVWWGGCREECGVWGAGCASSGVRHALSRIE